MSAPAPDLVTQIQQQTELVCSRMVDAVGPLQRDAPPVSIKGEPVSAPAGAASTPAAADTSALAAAKAGEVAEALGQLLSLIGRLPDDLPTEEQQLAELAAVLRDNTVAAEELQRAREEAERQVARLHEAHALLAEVQLRAKERG